MPSPFSGRHSGRRDHLRAGAAVGRRRDLPAGRRPGCRRDRPEPPRRRSNRLRQGLDPIPARDDLGHTANYLWMLRGDKPAAADVTALQRYLVTTVDHGFNASTFTARVVASTGADAAACSVGGIGALSGPLHGGAPKSRARHARRDRHPRPGRADGPCQARGGRTHHGLRARDLPGPGRPVAAAPRDCPGTRRHRASRRRGARRTGHRRGSRDLRPAGRAPSEQGDGHERRVLRRCPHAHRRRAAQPVLGHVRGRTEHRLVRARARTDRDRKIVRPMLVTSGRRRPGRPGTATLPCRPRAAGNLSRCRDSSMACPTTPTSRASPNTSSPASSGSSAQTTNAARAKSTFASWPVNRVPAVKVASTSGHRGESRSATRSSSVSARGSVPTYTLCPKTGSDAVRRTRRLRHGASGIPGTGSRPAHAWAAGVLVRPAHRRRSRRPARPEPPGTGRSTHSPPLSRPAWTAQAHDRRAAPGPHLPSPARRPLVPAATATPTTGARSVRPPGRRAAVARGRRPRSSCGPRIARGVLHPSVGTGWVEAGRHGQGEPRAVHPGRRWSGGRGHGC